MHLLLDMRETLISRISKYKELFHENEPEGDLKATLLCLRIINKTLILKEALPNPQIPHRESLKRIMEEVSIAKFQKFKEITAPLDRKNVTEVLLGISQITDFLHSDIEEDMTYFKEAFTKF